MNNLDSLRNLITRLNQEEHKNLIRFVNLSLESKHPEEGKTIQLIKLLRNQSLFSSSDIQKVIYGKLNYVAFNKLCNRLKGKIYEVILLDSSLSKGSYSQRNLQIFELRKMLINADILQLKGIRHDVISILDSVIKKAKKIEVYDVLLHSLYSKRRLVSGASSVKELKKLNSEIDNTEKCWMAINHSQNVFNEITNKISLSSDSNSYNEDLNFSIDEIKDAESRYDSAILRYYLCTLLAEKSQIEKDYKKSNEYFEEIRQLLERNVSIYTDNRIGSVLINLANNSILLKEFERAIKLSEESKNYFGKLPLTLKMVDETIFYSLFYMKRYRESEEFIQFDAKSKAFLSADLLVSKFNFYSACVDFCKGNFNESLTKLKEQKEIEKDKEGWNICKRILIIMNRIELNDFESVDLQVQNLQKFLKRLNKQKHLRLRYTTIVNILIKLINSNCDFKNVYLKRSKQFNQLGDFNDSSYGWRLKSPELVRFDSWFLSKC